MALFGEAKEPFLRQFLRLRTASQPRHVQLSVPPPRSSTIPGLLRAVHGALRGGSAGCGGNRWQHLAALVRPGGRQVAIAHGASLAADQRLLLGQIAVDDKSNEIMVMSTLLQMLSLRGTIVTADALNCQRAIAAQVVEQGGDYVLALNGNQGTLHEDVRLYLDDPAHAPALASSRAVDGDHGRIETRDAFVCTNIGWLQEQHRCLLGCHRQDLAPA